MGLTVFEKIIKEHLVSGTLERGNEIYIKVDQTLTQDATGTMAFLEFEAMGMERVKTKVSVSYVDHNTLQTGFENPDDHLFLQTAAKRFGVYFSRPGNGICHQVHLEEFAAPGQTLLGSDSHTPTAGGIGMVAIGAGGFDVAMAMAGEPFKIIMPEIWRVNLHGELPPMVSSKDVILHLLRILSVKGGLGKVFEYAGPGLKSLDVYQRATICNMGAELGLSTSIFPSDERTKEFLSMHGRSRDFRPIQADPDAAYDGEIDVDLSSLEPLVAKPHMPDNVVPAKELEGLRIDQVVIGSCTNSSLRDLFVASEILRGKAISENVSLGVCPGSRKVLLYLMKKGIIPSLIASGARLLECVCGPCIGMGFSPPSGGKSLRTFNRNFKGRSGTQDAEVYLASPEVAAASALRGEVTDPRSLGKKVIFVPPKRIPKAPSMIVEPADPEEAKNITIRKGPNIKGLPEFDALPSMLEGKVVLKVGDNITTDDIMPAGAKILPYRSNIEKLSEFCFTNIDENFPERAKKEKTGIIVGGENYGQGSSREHASLVPRFLGIRAVIAKSFSRIHRANLINFGIVPLTFISSGDYELISQGDRVSIPIKAEEPGEVLDVEVEGKAIKLRLEVHSKRELELLKAGGALNYIKKRFGGKP